MLRAVGALVVAGALTAAAGGDRARDYAQGRGLAETGNAIGFPHVRVGTEYWVSMPVQENVTGRPLTLLRTEWLHVPAGLRVLRYGVVTVEETGGQGLFVSDDEDFADLAPGVRVHAVRPIRVPAHGRADAYVLARVRVTGPVHEDLSGYRVRYRQGAVTYRQDLDWEAVLRLRPEGDRA
ncbi:hypothetical protein ABZ923_37680 [Streptomyces sp. NPDC046881]|uniref:hypothetical protein n=1 Tax=Streptomyces sp. NPDC046881 TaxID=3155374 RepID=UPI0033CC2B07